MEKLRIANKYGQIPNQLLNRNDISFKAKGLFGYMQSKPDGWKFTVELIASQSKEGTLSISQGLKELERFGYLKRFNYQDEKGKWTTDYVLLENKGEPLYGFPIADEPISDLTDTVKPYDISKKEERKKETPSLRDSVEKQTRTSADRTGRRAETVVSDVSSKSKLFSDTYDPSRSPRKPKENGSTKPRKPKSDADPNIPVVIKAFETYQVNASARLWYANVNKRKAVNALLEQFGLDNVIMAIQILPKTNGMPRYQYPLVKTPEQLLDNWFAIQHIFNGERETIMNNMPV